MTLRARTLIMVTLLLVGTVLVIGSVLTWNARQAILAQQEQDGLLIARLLARTAGIVDEFPQEMENAIGDQMVVEATIAAHMVAIAEQAGLTPDEINAHLKAVTDTTVLSEFWITDPNGHAYLHSAPGIDFSFSPDAQLQPQASVFWPLITGDAQVVVQEARQREIDPEVFKYVGVAGIDEARIVQVGYNASVLDDLRKRVGLERLIAALVAGGDVEAIRVVDSQTTTLVFSGSPGIDSTTLSAVDQARLSRVLQDGTEDVTLDGNLLKVIVPVRPSANETQVIGAVIVFLPTDRLQAAMARQLGGAATASVGVLVIGVAASLWLSRRISDPVARITQAATAVEKGEYKHAVLANVVGRRDELGRLGRVFDRMAREVSARDRRLKLLRKVIPAGVGLSSEKDFNRLLETIVTESQAITNADGGTLYMLEDDLLKFMIVRNTSMGLAMGGSTGNPITLPPLSLHDEKTGEPNRRNIAAHAALVREAVNIPDAYAAEGFDFSGTRAYDQRTGYHSQSLLSIPLESDDQQVIGVLQLINSQDPETGAVVPFVVDEVFETLVLLASISLAAYIRQSQLRKEIEKLNIEIDRSKQSRQVTEITETDYFRALLKKVRELRRKGKSKS
jgi:HAMP domain-containing protein